jgi:hypothetical protein
MTTTNSNSWGAIVLLLAAITPAFAQNNGKSQNGGGKYANLSANWWAWALSRPTIDIDGTNTNPILDTTGEFALVGQQNGIGPGKKYIFLAGTFGFDAVREVTIPAGKSLFFPVLNFNADNAVDPPTDFSVPELRAIARDNIDVVDSTYARINGEDVEVFRTKSPTFQYTLPEENSIYDYLGLVGPQFEGTVKPVVSDGYWAVIPPLAPGEYVVEFGGAITGVFSVNVTYLLTVE